MNFLRGAFIFQWRGWPAFLRELAVVQIGYVLFGLAINIMVQANLGTSPWVSLQVALTHYLPITLGQSVIGVALGIVALDILLREPLGWGTLANTVFIGLWVDWLLPLVPLAPPVLWLQLPYLLLGVLLMGFATAFYVGVQVGAGPRDSLMLAIARVGKMSLRRARTIIEIIVVALGWLLGGPVGLGTLIFAFTIGPSVQLAFRLLKVRPLQRVEAQPPARL